MRNSTVFVTGKEKVVRLGEGGQERAGVPDKGLWVQAVFKGCLLCATPALQTSEVFQGHRECLWWITRPQSRQGEHPETQHQSDLYSVPPLGQPTCQERHLPVPFPLFPGLCPFYPISPMGASPLRGQLTHLSVISLFPFLFKLCVGPCTITWTHVPNAS